MKVSDPMSTLNYGTTKIDYTLYSEQRTDIKILVSLENGVEVYAPSKLDPVKLNSLLKKKAAWIYRKLQSINEIKVNIQPLEMVSGEKIPYLGRRYRLKVHRRPVKEADFTFYQGRFIAIVPESWAYDRVQIILEDKLITWYRKQAEKKLKQRLTHYQTLFQTYPTSARIRTQHKRWGSCTPDGHIYINWRLIMAPLKVFDYVLVHELAHLTVPDHSPAFWDLVKMVMPDYEVRREWLRVNGMGLHCIG